MVTFPHREAEQMRLEFPSPPPAAWYEERKWPACWTTLGDLRGLQVLDLGCLTGWLGWLAKESGAHVVLTDIFETAAHPGLPFVPAQKEDLPFADETFDLVLTGNVLHHGDLAATCREAWRVLKPGGRLFSVQEPVIPEWKTEEQELAEFCAAELANGLEEHRYHARQYEAALSCFHSTRVWKSHGNPMLPGAHNFESTGWPWLKSYHGGVACSGEKR